MNTVIVEQFKAFDTLDSAYIWANNTANQLLRSGESVIANRIYADLFRKPKFRQIKLLGVSKRAANDCERLAPGGKWWVQCQKTPQGHQFMAWYSKYLPYAYAMIQAEQSFQSLGIDHDSINSYFRTVTGFVWIGKGEIVIESEPNNIHSLIMMGENAANLISTSKASVIEEEDIELYENCYCYSEASDASLPFFEAQRPAYCFLGIKNPKLFKKIILGMGSRTESEFEKSWPTTLLRKVVDKIGLPQPDFK
jgi:hypothetical protein